MHWAVLAPFFTDSVLPTVRWIDDFVPGTRHSFTKIARPDPEAGAGWHQRASALTPFAEWLVCWRQSAAGWRRTRGGLLTVFPQLAATAGLRAMMSARRAPMVAWCFNVGNVPSGLKQRLSRLALARFQRLVVHSTGEIGVLSRWLDLPASRFTFVPLQCHEIPSHADEDDARPFVLAMGSAHRDYATFLRCAGRLGYPTTIVAGRNALRGLEIPSCVEVVSGLTFDECHRLAQRARVNVVPLLPTVTAAGQVTLVQALRMGRAVVVTDCVGSRDYVVDSVTGLLVRPQSVDDMAEAISRAWEDAPLRRRLRDNARAYGAERLSDEAAGRALERILDEVEQAAA